VAGLDRGDRANQVLDCWLAKELVGDVYLTDDVELAASRLDDALAFIANSVVPELKTLGKSLRRWRSAILAHHTTGASNGPTEPVPGPSRSDTGPEPVPGAYPGARTRFAGLFELSTRLVGVELATRVLGVCLPPQFRARRCSVPANNLVTAQGALDSFLESHGHQLQSSGSQEERILVGILAALIEIAQNLGMMAAASDINERDIN
jgi:hypothetical protein